MAKDFTKKVADRTGIVIFFNNNTYMLILGVEDVENFIEERCDLMKTLILEGDKIAQKG